MKILNNVFDCTPGAAEASASAPVPSPTTIPSVRVVGSTIHRDRTWMSFEPWKAAAAVAEATVVPRGGMS